VSAYYIPRIRKTHTEAEKPRTIRELVERLYRQCGFDIGLDGLF